MASLRVTNDLAMRPGDRRKFDALATRRWRQRLLSWYDRNRRDLPWRRDRDPYRVWLSEIMLQQTRVSAVLEHYRRFLRRFPTVQKLASAREPAVLAAWSGLGYYRRARMMHAAAKAIVKQHGGRFPGGIAELRALPGIGRYTAAAIASIVFDVPAAVVDGNVERVLGRVFGTGLTGEGFWQTAETLLSRKRPGDFNQAMMELGATVCLPRQPRCSACPVFGLCATRGHLELPKKIEPSEAARYLLRARSSQPLGFPGAAAKTFVPDAGDVGIAGNSCREPAEPGQFHAAALHYCDRLHRPRDAWPGAGTRAKGDGCPGNASRGCR